MAVTDGFSALSVGMLAGLLLSSLIAVTSVSRIFLVPRPLCVAFLEVALHRPINLTTGLMVNVAWVALWSFFYVFLFWNRLPLLGAIGMATVLCMLSLLFFFPSVGWGYFGSKLGIRASVDSVLSYSIFAVVIWTLNRSLL